MLLGNIEKKRLCKNFVLKQHAGAIVEREASTTHI